MSSWFILAVLWTVAIFVACVLPGDNLPDVQRLSADKLVHFGIFFGFGALWMQALAGLVKRRVLWVVSGGVVLGVAIELVQALVPNRSPDPVDALADMLGLACAVGLYILWQRRRVVTSQSTSR